VLFDNDDPSRTNGFRSELAAKLDKNSVILYNLKKLTESVQELESELMAGEFDYYSTIADLIKEVNDQLVFFESFSALPHITLILEKVRAIHSEVKRQVLWSFREIGELCPVHSNTGGASVNSSPSAKGSVRDNVKVREVGDLSGITGLSQISLVVEALGANFRYDTLERFAQLQLISYEKYYSPNNNSPNSGIEHLDLRFQWFKQLLAATDAKLASYIPSKWGLKTHLYLEFARRTIHHLSDALRLAEAASADGIDVHTLLKAVKTVLSYENDIRRGLNLKAREIDDSEHDETSSKDDSVHNQDSGAKDSMNGIYYGVAVSAPRSVVMSTSKINIADAFDPFLGPYIQMEREGLESLMDKALEEEEKDGVFYDDNGVLRPKDAFASSLKMFEFIKKSLKRCTSFSTGFTYLALSKEFRICLHNYAGESLNNLLLN
jgi:hypothetical protein